MLSPLASRRAPKLLAIDVYKSPTCGCCRLGQASARQRLYGDHARCRGHRVVSRSTVPDRFGSCHTGVIAGYGIEGHVPAADIKKLAGRSRSRRIGCAGHAGRISPGMEYGSRKDPFDVLLVKPDGAASVFSSYNKAKS
jgi:hypothetical protein